MGSRNQPKSDIMSVPRVLPDKSMSGVGYIGAHGKVSAPQMNLCFFLRVETSRYGVKVCWTSNIQYIWDIQDIWDICNMGSCILCIEDCMLCAVSCTLCIQYSKAYQVYSKLTKNNNI